VQNKIKTKGKKEKSLLAVLERKMVTDGDQGEREIGEILDPYHIG
jgi:hypothetical protein